MQKILLLEDDLNLNRGIALLLSREGYEVRQVYTIKEAKRDFEKISPIHHVSEATPSTLILLGTKDPIVSVETIEAYQDKLLQKGVDCELHLFEGAGHPIFLYRKPLTEEYYKVRKLTDDFLKRQGFL